MNTVYVPPTTEPGSKAFNEVDCKKTKMVPIFAGGGTRLLAHIGILKAIEELGISFDHIVGVSGGSIVGSLYSAGYSLHEIEEIALGTSFSRFKGFSLLTLLRDGGLCSGDQFESWIDQKLSGITFKQLTHNLHIVATDVAEGKPVIFNQQTVPDMKVSRAVRYSMSIPLLFSFKKFKNYVMADGSILSEDALHRDWAGDGTPVLCFRLRSQAVHKWDNKRDFFPLKTYVSMLIRTFMNTVSREYINEKLWHNTIIVNTGSISPIDFNLTDAEKQQLLQAGYDTALSLIPNKVIPFIDSPIVPSLR
jgi:NTE family protein